MCVQKLEKNFLKKHIDEFINIIKNEPHEDWQEEHFLLELPGKWHFSMVVLGPQKEILGFMIVSQKENDRVHIHKFMVKKNWRGKGIGSLLLSELYKKCKQHGIKRMSLKVYRDNPRAINFYRRYGFSIFKVTTQKFEMMVNIKDMDNLLKAKTW